MAVIQLNPPYWVTTPKGPGIAYILDTKGEELDAVWGVAQEDGQFWFWPTPKIRFYRNHTMGRTSPEVMPLDTEFDKLKLKKD